MRGREKEKEEAGCCGRRNKNKTHEKTPQSKADDGKWKSCLFNYKLKFSFLRSRATGNQPSRHRGEDRSPADRGARISTLVGSARVVHVPRIGSPRREFSCSSGEIGRHWPTHLPGKDTKTGPATDPRVADATLAVLTGSSPRHPLFLGPHNEDSNFDWHLNFVYDLTNN